MTRILTTTRSVVLFAALSLAAAAQAQTIDTRIGTIELQDGYPSDESVAKLYDELDFQRAVQAYIWAMPTVAIDGWRFGAKRDWGVDYNGVSLVDKFVPPAVKVLTGNSTTIYAIATVYPGRDGPIVIESPTGAYGVIDDYWQRPVVEIGPIGPDKGKGGKFLVVPPGYKGDLPQGYMTVHSPTNQAFYLVRGIVRDSDVSSAVDTLAKIRIYPLSQAANPPETHVFRVGDKAMDSIAPRGFEYWERLADIINKETVEERDRFFHAMLKPLGIEKGKPFAPDERQKKILTEAAKVGFLMTQTISMAPRFANVQGYPGTQWKWILPFNPDQRGENYEQLDERADYTFQAATISAGMMKPVVGAGSQYMNSAKDKNGKWLDGSKTYRLHVPADAPVKDFWSFTLYDNLTRSMIQTDTNKAALSSYDKLKTNADGSVDLYFGPTAPKGFESNWIKTTPGKGWFTLFRWFGPTQAFFDKTWRLPDIEEVN